jgi:hypothetical protein
MTVANRKIKIGNVTFLLIDTRGGYIGPDEDNLKEAFTYANLNRAKIEETNASLNTTDMFTGKVRIPLGGEYRFNAQVFVRQSDPLPITIGFVVGEAEVGGVSSS